MKVEILCRELIKPYTDTPLSFRNYNISLIDEISPTINIPTIFYYPASDIDHVNTTLIYDNLKKSLSNILTSFYPLAGRYCKDSHSVDCGDQGAEYVQAKVDVCLNELLSKRMNLETELLNDLLPVPLGALDEYTDPLLAAQVSVFTCGGFAIGVCGSHRIVDMSSTMSFIKAWAIAARQGLGYIDENYKPISFNYDSALLFPGKNLSGIPLGLSRFKEDINIHKIATKMLYLSKSKISSIQERARLENSNKMLPSRVQSVFGIIGKAIIDVRVANPEKSSKGSGYIFIETVNMRERTVPPLPKNQFGNLYLAAFAQSVADPQGVELGNLVNCLSNSVKKAIDNCGMLLSLGKDERQTIISHDYYELMKSFSNPEICVVGTLSSWCKFPMYEADFGWGKPIWVSIVNYPMKDTVVLMDDKSGEGIEAWVSLDENDMHKFIQHADISDIIMDHHI